MRAVSSATWTSGDPVSPSWDACLAISSLLTSLVRGTAGEGRNSRLSSPRSGLGGLLAVLPHLLTQPLGRFEAQLVAQALEEVQAHVPPVEIPFEPDQG